MIGFTQHRTLLNRQFIRLLSKKDDTTILADALNLLSPKQAYKPSLYDNLTKGPVNEQYNVKEVKLKTSNIHQDYVSSLLQDLSFISKQKSHDLLNMSDKELLSYIKSLLSEPALIKVYNSLFQYKKLDFKLLSLILLNKNLHNLLAIGIKNGSLEVSLSQVDLAKLQILLLKKNHDLKKPLEIIKILKNNLTSFLSLIESGQLPPFYERIVWKFNFIYIKQFNEVYYIEKLQNLQSAILIWESTGSVNPQIVESIEKYDLSELQRIFFKLVSCPSIQSKIDALPHYLINFKKLSTKFKICQLEGINPNLVKALENIIYHELSDLPMADHADLREVLSELKQLNKSPKNYQAHELKWLDNVINA